MQETRSYLKIILESCPPLAVAHNFYFYYSQLWTKNKQTRLLLFRFVLVRLHKIYTSCNLVLSRKYVSYDNSIKSIKPVPIDAPCEVL